MADQSRSTPSLRSCSPIPSGSDNAPGYWKTGGADWLASEGRLTACRLRRRAHAHPGTHRSAPARGRGIAGHRPRRQRFGLGDRGVAAGAAMRRRSLTPRSTSVAAIRPDRPSGATTATGEGRILFFRDTAASGWKRRGPGCRPAGERTRAATIGLGCASTLCVGRGVSPTDHPEPRRRISSLLDSSARDASTSSA
jgi:hypothetical protein